MNLPLIEIFCKGSKIYILRVVFCRQLRCKVNSFNIKIWALLQNNRHASDFFVSRALHYNSSLTRNKIGTHCGIFVAIPHAGFNAKKEIETKKAVSFQKQLSKYIKNLIMPRQLLLCLLLLATIQPNVHSILIRQLIFSLLQR